MKKNGPSHLRIVVESGSDFGEEFTFVAGDEFIIGRGRYCNIVIDDKGASRKHTQIVCVERELILRDLDSSNGTFVNGERIIERKLIDQDVVEIVDLRLRAVYIKRGVKPVFPPSPPAPRMPGSDSDGTLRNLHSGSLAPGALLGLIKDLRTREMTGRITVRAVWGSGRIHLMDGTPIDAKIDCSPEIKPRKAVQRLLRAHMGTMQFRRCEVEPPKYPIQDDIEAIHEEDEEYDAEFLRFVKLAPSIAAELKGLKSDSSKPVSDTEAEILNLVSDYGLLAKISDHFDGSDTLAMKTLSDLIENERVGF